MEMVRPGEGQAGVNSNIPVALGNIFFEGQPGIENMGLLPGLVGQNVGPRRTQVKGRAGSCRFEMFLGFWPVPWLRPGPQ